MRSRDVVSGLVLVGLGVLVACGSADSSAQAAAVDFYRAASAGETSAACQLLAPETRRELEQAEQASCREAMDGIGLPPVDGTVATERFGHQAQVRFDGDTTFLAEYDDGWKVVAAGCVARDPLPYDCVIEGG